MPTWRTLGELRAELARRLGFGAQGSAGINAGLLDSFLQNAQDQLHAQFDWRHLIKYDEETTGVGQTLYDWAPDCEPTRLLSVAVWDNAQWVPLTEGITWAMRGTADSQTLPARYERFAQMEVWPEPDAVYTLRRYYVAQPARFTQDNDRASLDDALILLHAITNAKLHYRQQDGQVYANQLNAMIQKLKAQNRGAAVMRRTSDPDDVYLARPRDV
jgi:hypothetical protein